MNLAFSFLLLNLRTAKQKKTCCSCLTSQGMLAHYIVWVNCKLSSSIVKSLIRFWQMSIDWRKLIVLLGFQPTWDADIFIVSTGRLSKANWEAYSADCCVKKAFRFWSTYALRAAKSSLFVTHMSKATDKMYRDAPKFFNWWLRYLFGRW